PPATDKKRVRESYFSAASTKHSLTRLAALLPLSEPEARRSMKIINSKSIVTTLILAAGVIPAFGQARGRGSERGSERSGHSQFQQQRSFQGRGGQRQSERGDSFRNRAVPQSRSDARQYGGNAYRNENGARREYNSRGNSFGGARHYVIPRNRFNGSFGRGHFFRI